MSFWGPIHLIFVIKLRALGCVLVNKIIEMNLTASVSEAYLATFVLRGSEVYLANMSYLSCFNVNVRSIF